MFTASGTLFATKVKTYVRSGDGSVMFRVSQTFPKPEPITMQILDTRGETRAFVDDLTRSVTTVKLPHETLAEMISGLSSEGCPSGVNLSKLPEAEEILGIKTRYYVEETSTMTDERWVVPDLNCLILKEIKTSHEFQQAHNEMLATAITFGEPAASVRTIPPFYSECSPKDLESRHIAAAGGPGLLGPVAVRQLSKYY